MKCEKNIVSIYSSGKPCEIYCNTCWWGDAWNALDYGRDFDFSKSFFEQWNELYSDVPKISLIALGDSVNSDYTHDAYRLKDCYMIFDGEQAWDCYCGETFVMDKDCVDFLVARQSELCYEAMYVENCYNCSFIRFCKNCSESSFLLDCIGCKNCLGCVNLRQKQHCVFNKQYSRDEYEKILKDFDLGSFEKLEKFKIEFEKFASVQPKRAYRGVKNEDVSGDNIDNCKNVFNSFDCVEARDCKYCTNMQLSATDCMDMDIWGDRLSVVYNCECVGAGGNNLMCDYYVVMNVSNVYYSVFCFNGTNDCFGCVGLMHKRFCIFNKQYEEGEYLALRAKIVEHMKKTGEWGQFFPISTSSFGYNETVAMDYFKLERDEVLKRGYKWKEKDQKEYLKQDYVVSDHINDVPDSIIDEVLACCECGRNFKIIPQELKFYKKKGVPIPRKCYLCRHIDRTKFRNPRKLHERKCDKCGVEMKTPYKDGDVVYCLECYNKMF